LALLALAALAGGGCGSPSPAGVDAAVTAPDAAAAPDAGVAPSSSLMGTSAGGGVTGATGGYQLEIGVGQPVMGTTGGTETGAFTPAKID
jgi:hypothetical protein